MLTVVCWFVHSPLGIGEGMGKKGVTSAAFRKTPSMLGELLGGEGNELLAIGTKDPTVEP